ncbi:hypothetical protein RHMOL_Rhmol04G0133000 [Rhododendron molle]|uniref:Uncharacterized protein n=1 Tax=Rhododendron molle TaxID=49168 RepID=A0ACC0P241_RHOML|nr:hypothetical protein RHMOL_Rhmol04G0133000 [Rhododendron molle]
MTIVYSTNIKTRKRDYSNGFFFNKYYLLKKIKKVFVLQQRLLPSFSLVLLQSFETLTVKTIKLVLPSPQPRVSVSPAMASSIQGLVPAACPGLRSRRLSHPSSSTSSFSVAAFPESGRRFPYRRKMVRKAEDCGVCRVMVQQAAVQGASAAYAKEMERLSAKESLLLAFKDAGGFEALVTGKTTDMQRIDVNERIIGLERLNPSPRPTTYPGRHFWKGSGILSGLDLEAQDYLRLDSFFSEYCLFF